MRRFALVLVVSIGILAVMATGRTIAFRSRQLPPEAAAPLLFDRDSALQKLSRAIQFQTVSQRESVPTGLAEFTGLREYLRAAFPSVHSQLDREIVGGQSLLYTWRGESAALKPILLMAHMDVVPADEKGWRHPPFSGAVTEGYLWGRGAMDDKAGMLGILEAVESLLAENFRPKRTIYLAFGHDEEVGGEQGAKRIAELLRGRGAVLEFVLDEGLNIFDGLIPGVASPVALVGIAEKGYLSLRLTTQVPAGHSSIPPPQTAIGILSKAIQRLHDAPFPSRLSGATLRMLEFLGPEMSWHNRLGLANLWLFDPLVRHRLAQSPLTNASIRTTLAPTIFQAGGAENVLPAEAAAVVNLRLMPGESIAGVTERVRRIVNDPLVAVTPLSTQVEPSSISDPSAPPFHVLQRTIRQIVPAAIVAPGLLVGATDSRHYAPLTPNVFRFLPIILRADDAKRYHGMDERISVEDYERCVRFYAQLIRNAQP